MKRETSIFSPILPINAFNSSARFLPFTDNAINASTFSGLLATKASKAKFAKFKKSSFLATKSVSQFTSIIAADLPPSKILVNTVPSLAVLSARFAATAAPFLRKISIATSKTPLDSSSAFLQSIIPAPVLSLNSFTCCALTAIKLIPCYYYVNKSILLVEKYPITNLFTIKI